MAKSRQLWWQCSYQHTGCVPGHLTYHTKDEFGRFLVTIEQTHFKLHPLCHADHLRLAPKRVLLNNDGVALTWQIDHVRIHQGLKDRQDTRIIVNA